MKLPKIRMPNIKTQIVIIDIVVSALGIVMIGKGLYMIYPPLMYIVLGTIFAFPGMPKRGVK